MTTFRFFTPELDPATTLCVDGVVDGYRCLSHWPGNATPTELKHDLSTGILLAWARLSPSERERLVGGFDVVTNHHYDTDGVLSAFTAMRPAEALAHEELLLDAAATGDFGLWRGSEALAIELSIMAVADAGCVGSPLRAEVAAAGSSSERWEIAYRWLIDELPALLDAPDRLEHLWAERHATVLHEIASFVRGVDVDVEHVDELDLAVVTRRAPITKYGLHELAGDRSRVLLVRPWDDGGWRYRFVYRVESWFDLARPSPPPRVALDAALAALALAELPSDATWWATPLDAPVAAAGFGPPSRADETFFDDPDLSADATSRVPPELVTAAFVEALAGA